MGAVGQRHVIRGLAVVVGLNMVVALVAVYAHAGDASDREARSRQPAATSSSTSPGILAGGHFGKRRGTGSTATTATTQGAGAAGSDSPSTGPGTPGTTSTSGPPTTSRPPGGDTGAAGATTTTAGRSTPGGTARTTTTTAGTTTSTGGTTTSTAPAGGATGHAGTVSDPTGDTFIDGTTDPIKQGRADIVRAGAAYGPGGLTFTMQIAQPDDPRTDTTWASDSTFAMWSVDTNADGKPDYEIDFTRAGDALSGVVAQPGDSGATICDASSATYGPDGYAVTVDPACLGNPAAVAFRATMYYDTNPKDENADVASDLAPNGGLSFPVTRP